MAAVSPNHRPGCARLGFARLNAFRLSVYEAWLRGNINGSDFATAAPGYAFMIEGASVQHVLNDQTDTAAFTFRTGGFVPMAGHAISVAVGDTTDQNNLLFGGRILETTVGYEARAADVRYDLRCVDPTWLMQRRLVLATYAGWTAGQIAVDLATKYCRNITTRGVQGNLPVIDAITFTNEQVPACLTAVCQRVGAYWYLDYQNDLHVFTNEGIDANPITDANPRTSRNHRLSEDLSQVVTTVIGRGGGVGAAIDLPAGQVEIPVEEGDEAQSWYAPTGGLVEINAQRVTYSGVRGTGSTGALVGTGNAPSAALTFTPYYGTNLTPNARYGYSATFVTASGETLAGPVGTYTAVTINPIAPPAVSGRSRGSGAYPPGMISPGANAFRFSVQIGYRGGAWGPMAPESVLYGWDGNDWEVYIGPRQNYTAPDGSAAFYYPTLEPNGPAAPTSSVWILRIDNAGGLGWMAVSSDSFYDSWSGYVRQCACSYGSGGAQPVSGYGSVEVQNIPISQASGVTSRRLYRTTANGSALKLLTTIADNTATKYHDQSTDAALGAAPPATDTSGIKDEGQVLVGATQMVVSSTAPFQADAILSGPTPGGWVRVGGMVVRYTGIGTGMLTGIPASGLGSITATIRYGAQVLIQPRLIGVPASGTGALLQPIRKGDTVTIRIELTDTAAQNAMAERLKLPGYAADPADGVIELALSDSRLGLVELAAHVQATLTERKEPHRTLTFESRDPSLQVGRLISVTLTTPPIGGTFRIQRVTFSEIAIAGGRGTVYPLRSVEATNKLYTFADLLRQLRGREGGIP